jgi:hypothetical protein
MTWTRTPYGRYRSDCGQFDHRGDGVWLQLGKPPVGCPDAGAARGLVAATMDAGPTEKLHRGRAAQSVAVDRAALKTRRGPLSGRHGRSNRYLAGD